MDSLRAAIEQPLKINPSDCHIRVGEVSEPISVGGKEPYDQTSLELCEGCGWRAMIPGEGCLTCARQKAKRQWVWLTAEEINAIYVQHHNQFGECLSGDWGYERDLEAKLKEKNV
jgi:hypothetical protein